MQQNWKIGDVILDLYQVTDFLGEGGFGKVYKVRHQMWNMDLAVKILKPESIPAVGDIESFEREAETWVNLGLHPHIVSCYYVRRIENIPAVFAEYLAAGNLRDSICNRRLYTETEISPLQRLLDVAIQFAWGLHYAHEQGLIHQDIKPDNVLLTLNGAVKIADFGIASTKGTTTTTMNPVGEQSSIAENLTLQLPGSGKMTLPYCSPEQANQGTLTRRSDIWSWGLSVLEMFTGERTWSCGFAAAQVLDDYLEREPANRLLPKMPAQIADLLRHCFQEKPEHRPHNMLTIADKLRVIYQQVTGKIYLRPEPQAGKDSADSLNNRAISLWDLGRQQEALHSWDLALQTQPLHPEATYNRGLTFWRSGQIPDDALVREMERMHQSHAESWRVDYLLGLVYLEREPRDTGLLWFVGKLIESSRSMISRFPYLSNNFNYFVSFQLSSDARFAIHNRELWDLATGQCLCTIEGSKFGGSSLISLDNNFVLSSGEGVLKLWDIYNGKHLPVNTENIGDLTIIRPNSNSPFAFAIDRDKRLRHWDNDLGIFLDCHQQLFLEANPQLVSINAYDYRSVHPSMSDDGRWILSAAGKMIHLWDVETGTLVQTLEGHRNEVRSLYLSANGWFALSTECYFETILRVWDMSTGQCLYTFEVDKNITTLDLSIFEKLAGNQQQLDENVYYYPIHSYLAPPIFSQVLETESVLSIDLAFQKELEQAQTAWESGNYVAVARHLRQARSQPGYNYDSKVLEMSERLYKIFPHKELIGAWEIATFVNPNSLGSISASANNLVLCGGYHGEMWLWDISTGECLQTFEEYESPIHEKTVMNSRSVEVFLSKDGSFALSSGDSIKSWNIKTGTCLHTFERGEHPSLSCLAVSGSLAVIVSDTIRLCDITTGRCLRTFEGHSYSVKSACLSSDGGFVLFLEADKQDAENYDHSLKLWDIATGRCLRSFKVNARELSSVCLSADGRLALIGGGGFSNQGRISNYSLQLWDLGTGACLRLFEGHTKHVGSVCFSNDSRFALSGSGDRTVKLWDIATGVCLHTFEGHEQQVNSVCFSNDSGFALSAGRDRLLKVWKLVWEVEDRLPANWDEGARPYLENFLTLQTPYTVTLPIDREPTETELTLALTRRGTPIWTDADFQNLLDTLGCAGYGWLSPKGVRQQLETMAQKRNT